MAASFYKDIKPLARSTQLVRGGVRGSYPRPLAAEPQKSWICCQGLESLLWGVAFSLKFWAAEAWTHESQAMSLQNDTCHLLLLLPLQVTME